MKKIKSLLISLSLLVAPAMMANQPDSVYLFSFSSADGGGGLRLAWGADGKTWQRLNNDASVVNSDFGEWGSMKRMYNPYLVYNNADGLWHCTWDLSQGGGGVAHATSRDLIRWSPQQYYMKKADAPQAQPQVIAKVGSKNYKGYINRVPYSTVEALQRFSDSRAYRDMLYGETMADEPKMKPFKASIKVHTDSMKPISNMLTGIFFEDINYAADGGLYGELLQNRDFEYSSRDNGNWSPSYAWTALNAEGKEMPLTIESTAPVHANNSHYAIVADGTSIVNSGWEGIPVKQGAKYRLSFFAHRQAGKGAQLTVSLIGKNSEVLAQQKVSVKSNDWKKYTVNLTAKSSADDARLRIDVADGVAALDVVSLFPHDTFRGRENGLRKDLAQTLADMKPRFIRFPGGCVAHGNGIDNIYDWKGSVGPIETRKPLRNIWSYHQTRGLGYYEYFQFCEDIGAEPLPVLAAGVPCQNSAHPAHHSHDEVSNYGQQGGIPMEEMPAYIQDVLDLIEWANGDARTSEWARLRAKAGHPKPFNLKYIGIGNEDMITEVFESRFKMIADAVKAKYPELTIVGTVGPFYEGTDYERGWEFATEQNIPMVDEHYYVSPGWLIHNNGYYDNYDRSKPKVYLGEYAAHLPGRPNNIETALSEAIYLTGVERNGDVVCMSSYAPLLAKDNHTQWNPDLIYFNNTEVKPTPGYYVQQLYGLNPGTHYVASDLSLDTDSRWAKNRVKCSVVTDARTGDYIIKLANLNPAEVSTDIELGTVPALMNKMTVSVLTGDPADTKAKPTVSQRPLSAEEKGGKLSVSLPAHSFTVLRLSAK